MISISIHLRVRPVRPIPLKSTRTVPSFDRKNYVVAILALLVSTVSVVLAYLAIRASWQIAEASGSFDKASIEVTLGGYPLAVAKENFIVIGAPEMSAPNVPVVGALPFAFQSTGKKSLESLVSSFQYHDLFKRQLLELADSKISGAFSASELRKTTSAEANRFFVSYSLANLNPGVSLHIGEPIFLGETYIHDTVPITTKDGVSMTIPYVASYSKKFGLAVSARDTQVLGYSLSVSVQKATSLRDLTTGQLLTHIANRQKELRNELGPVSYLAALLTSAPTEQAFLVYVPLKQVSAGKAVVFEPTGQQEVAAVRFPLLSWSRLFKSGA